MLYGREGSNWTESKEAPVLVWDSVTETADSMELILQNKWYHTVRSAVLNEWSRDGASLAACALFCGKQLYSLLHALGIGCSIRFSLQPASSGLPRAGNENLSGFSALLSGNFLTRCCYVRDRLVGKAWFEMFCVFPGPFSRYRIGANSRRLMWSLGCSCKMWRKLSWHWTRH